MKSFKLALLGSFLSLTGSVFAISPVDVFYYDTQYNENNELQSKTVYRQTVNKGAITPKVHYDYVYNTEGRIIEKKAKLWNEKDKRWEIDHRYTYIYNESEKTVTLEFAKWDNLKKKYSLKKGSMVYTYKDARAILKL